MGAVNRTDDLNESEKLEASRDLQLTGHNFLEGLDTREDVSEFNSRGCVVDEAFGLAEKYLIAAVCDRKWEQNSINAGDPKLTLPISCAVASFSSCTLPIQHFSRKCYYAFDFGSKESEQLSFFLSMA